MGNSPNYVGWDRAQEDRAELTAPVIDLVSLSGWYECRDESVAYFAWSAGRLTLMRVVRSWEEVDRG